jgi:hypothetical protein
MIRRTCLLTAAILCTGCSAYRGEPADVRTMLLKQYPPGTSETDVRAGMERDGMPLVLEQTQSHILTWQLDSYATWPGPWLLTRDKLVFADCTFDTQSHLTDIAIVVTDDEP